MLSFVSGMDNEMHVYSQWGAPKSSTDNTQPSSSYEQTAVTSEVNSGIVSRAGASKSVLDRVSKLSTIRISQSVSNQISLSA